MCSDHPQATDCDGHPVWNFEAISLFADDVPAAHDDGQHAASERHHDQKFEKPGRLDPQRKSGQKFDIPAAHHLQSKQSGEDSESSQCNAKLRCDARPQGKAAGPPEDRCGKRNTCVQPVINLAAVQVGKCGEQQGNCQATEQSVVEIFEKHLAPRFPLGDSAKDYDLPQSNHSQRVEIRQVNGPPLEPINRRAIPSSAIETFWAAPDGHKIRRIDWAVEHPQRGSILFFPGRGDNYEKYLEALEQWHREGWRVTAADWRGQAGSGRLGNDAVTGHVDDFDLWVEDLAALWKEWKAQVAGPHVLAAHSMGGHLVLRALAERRVDPDAMVLSAPMLGFAGALPPAVGHAAAKLMCAIGDPKRQAWKWSEKPGVVPAGRQALLTHDDDRYQDELWWREERPELVMGPGSWGWVERAYASMRTLFDGDKLEQVQTPVFIVATSNDKLVGIKAIDEAARRLPNSEILRFGKEAHHEVLREVDAVRSRAMNAINDFLDRMAPRQ